MGILSRLSRRLRSDAAPSVKVRQVAGGTQHPVAARRDGLGGRWQNPDTGQGGALDRHARTEFTPPANLPISSLDALIEFSGVARRIVFRESEDATRRGYDLEGFNEPAVEAIEKEQQRIGLLPNVAEGRAWGRAFGGGAVVMLADDGRESWEPIDFSNLRKLRALRTVDRQELQVALWDERPESSRFSTPLVWSLNSQFGHSTFIHRSRVVHFSGTLLPLRTRIARGGHGGSELDLVWAELRNWLTSNEYAAEAITVLSQGVFKVKGLADAIDADDISEVVARFEALRIGMGMLGDIAVDGEGEDYQILGRPLSGLRDALDGLTSALVAATDMPRAILLGETPGGLNSGENAGEIRSWYDHVGSLQGTIYTPAVRRILEVMLRASEGPTRGLMPPKWTIEWRPLWEPTEGEQAQTDLTNAQRRTIDKNSGAVSADEIRQDPDLVRLYSIDPTDPAPPPPTPAEAGGAPLEGEGDEADAADDELDDADGAAIVQARIMPPAGEQLISARMAGQRLGYKSGSPIRRMAEAGTIPAWRVNNQWRFAWSTIMEAVTPKADRGRHPATARRVH